MAGRCRHGQAVPGLGRRTAVREGRARTLGAIPLVPTGGIALDQAAGYLAAGATALGMGGPLVGDACEGGSLEALRERTAGLLEAISR